MQDLPLDQLRSRADAERLFQEPDPGVKAFLLQNLRREGDSWRWQSNLAMVAADAAQGSASRIADWPIEAGTVHPFHGPVLWIAGSESRYITPEDAGPMRELFPRVRQLGVKGASHWVHSDAPDVVVEALRRFVAAGGRAKG